MFFSGDVPFFLIGFGEATQTLFQFRLQVFLVGHFNHKPKFHRQTIIFVDKLVNLSLVETNLLKNLFMLTPTAREHAVGGGKNTVSCETKTKQLNYSNREIRRDHDTIGSDHGQVYSLVSVSSLPIVHYSISTIHIVETHENQRGMESNL